jgi:hypothetical protein
MCCAMIFMMIFIEKKKKKKWWCGYGNWQDYGDSNTMMTMKIPKFPIQMDAWHIVLLLSWLHIFRMHGKLYITRIKEKVKLHLVFNIMFLEKKNRKLTKRPKN